jgi:uncharacterized protein (DUF58 family)
VRDGRAPVPLLPRRRVHGTPLGDMRSARRGEGAELVGLRAYRRGDDLRRLDHRSSARLSCAKGQDVLVVREFYAEESARVVLVVDASSSMRLYGRGLPWLDKPSAVRELVRLLLESAADARSPVGFLSAGADGGVAWWPPTRRPRPAEWEAAERGPRPLADVLGELGRLPRLGKGTFVFVVSDFLEPPGEAAWWPLLARGFDPVPVVLQDPTWEQSFPAIGGRALPVARVDGSRPRLVRVSRREADRLRHDHEARRRTTFERLRALMMDPVAVDSHEPAAVGLALRRWAAARGGGAA